MVKTTKTFTIKMDVTAMDIPTMARMSITDYKVYIRKCLLAVDHHVLRSEAAGYPLAVTKYQFKALLEYLQEIEPQIGSRS